MSRLFVVEDEVHAELQGRFRSMAGAMEDLPRLAEVPRDQDPVRAPCFSWRTCHRDYVVVEYDDSENTSWEEIRRTPVFEISAEGVVWANEA